MKYNYQYRIKANFLYDPSRVYDPPTNPDLFRFDTLLWHGWDEGYCVYKKDSRTGEIVRIDFLS